MALSQRGEWDELSYASGAGGEILCNPSEVIEGLVDSLAEVNSGLALGRDRILEASKHIACSWEGDSHGPQFTEDGMPLLHAGAPL